MLFTYENGRKERFWNDLYRVLDRVGNAYQLCVGRINVNKCAGWELKCNDTLLFSKECIICVLNTYFKHKNICKYTRVVRNQDGLEVMSMIDWVLVKRNMLKYKHDVKKVWGMGWGISDYYLTMRKVRLVDTWIKRKKMNRAQRI